MILLNDKKLGSMVKFQPAIHTEIDLYWNWKSFGFMLFCYPESPDGSKAFSLQLLWPQMVFTFYKRKRT
jgi:hypothetical protein